MPDAGRTTSRRHIVARRQSLLILSKQFLNIVV